MGPAARQILIAKMTTTGLLLRFQETATLGLWPFAATLRHLNTRFRRLIEREIIDLRNREVVRALSDTVGVAL